jgi:prevent-host-death family protein
MSEITVGVRDLKARLSEYLHKVKEGQTILITEHGKAVGRILPVELSMDERILNLVQAGQVEWNGEKLNPVEPAATNRSGRQVADLLVEMRE